ncbi:MAG: hypothetical protein IJY87_06355 [Bacilli bacterium]|nr:hypothetical protein [Bacilli bacterium]
MKKKNIIIIASIVIIAFISLFILITGRARTDVYLKDYEISSDGKTMTLKIDVTNSSGYVRKMKRTSGSTNYYYTFYSTFGINSKIGAKDTFTINLDENVNEIYFYTGDGGYKLVLQKDINDNWIKPLELEKNEILLETKKTNNCNKKPILYVEGDIKVYSYCLDSISIYKDNKFWELKDWMKSINQTISTSIEKITSNDYLWDDVILYKDGGSKIYTSDKMNILVCKTISGNSDVYIGDNSMSYELEFCN